MSISINPGAGPLGPEHSPEAAAHNVAQLAEDLRSGGHEVAHEPILELVGDEAKLSMGGPRLGGHDGRYPFRVTVNGTAHLVEMPGMALEAVRYVSGADQNIWDFPRLYVDGSSWVWQYALGVLGDGGDQ